jgi:hypothetical protein
VHRPPQLWRQVLRDKLRYAIAHCKAIDTDFAARGPAAGPGAAGSLGDDVDADADDQPAAAGAAGAAVGWGTAGAAAVVTEYLDDGEWELLAAGAV